MQNKAEVRKKCVLCSELRDELKRVGIGTFLHKHISNTHVADVILDYVQDAIKSKGKQCIKYFCKHCNKIWEYEKCEEVDAAMISVCPTCFESLTKVNVAIEE